jgi:hypothetical protein
MAVSGMRALAQLPTASSAARVNRLSWYNADSERRETGVIAAGRMRIRAILARHRIRDGWRRMGLTVSGLL